MIWLYGMCDASEMAEIADAGSLNPSCHAFPDACSCRRRCCRPPRWLSERRALRSETGSPRAGVTGVRLPAAVAEIRDGAAAHDAARESDHGVGDGFPVG